MRLAALFLLLTCCVNAQGTFRILDSQNNDVTSGIVYVTDTSAGSLQVSFTVQNTDSVTHNVTAGRVVISQAPGAANAFIWGQMQYVPSMDSSTVDEFIAPAGTQTFIAYYFPNNSGDTATINYCFWERTNMNNISCVTVRYNHAVPAGITSPVVAPAVTVSPNPARTFIAFGWSEGRMKSLTVFSSTGEIVKTMDLENETAQLEITDWAEGLYFYQIVGTNGELMSGTFIHAAE